MSSVVGGDAAKVIAGETPRLADGPGCGDLDELASESLALGSAGSQDDESLRGPGCLPSGPLV